MRSAFDVELALDRLEAQLAAVLPAHVRAFARAHAARQPEPGAPELIGAPATVALVADARHRGGDLAARGEVLARLCVPYVVESDVAVAAARTAQPRRYAAVAAARDRVCRAQFGAGHRVTMHALYGVPPTPLNDGTEPKAPMFDAWIDADGGPRASIEDVWRELAARRGAPVDGLTIVRAAARPRTFVVVPRREVIVVVSDELAAPISRFYALHELGHAACALTLGDVPRALDEGHAAAAARAMEDPTHPWYSPLAVAARARRLVLARKLDALEADPERTDAKAAPLPWALWGDPQAQAAYVAAEAIADAMSA